MTCTYRKTPFFTHDSLFSHTLNGVFNTAFGEAVTKKHESGFFNPSTNILAHDDRYILQLALPGFSKEDINIQLVKDTLTINGRLQKSANAKKGGQREFNFSSFNKSFHIPKNLDNETLKASFENGVLEITLFKTQPSEENSSRKINIQ